MPSSRIPTDPSWRPERELLPSSSRAGHCTTRISSRLPIAIIWQCCSPDAVTFDTDHFSRQGSGPMPLYEYECSACRTRFEVRQRVVEDPITVCPSCGGETRRVFHPVGIIFKG